VWLVASVLAGRKADAARPVPHGHGAERKTTDPRRRGSGGAARRNPCSFLAYPSPLWDVGKLTGAVNTLVYITGRKEAERSAQRLVAIVESSDDATLTSNRAWRERCNNG
jgi:hypothetical protein